MLEDDKVVMIYTRDAKEAPGQREEVLRAPLLLVMKVNVLDGIGGL